MFRSRRISFGIAVAMLLATVASLTPRNAAADDAHVLFSGYVVVRYVNPGNHHLQSYGHYLVTLYDNGDGNDGGLQAACNELKNDYHIPVADIMLVDEKTGLLF